MDNVVTMYHGGSVEEDEFGNVSFVGMRRVPLIFDDRPLLSELLGRAREELHCNSNGDAISVEGILHFGKSGRIFRRLVPIASEGEWEKYVKTVMKNEFQCLDLVVRKLSNDPTPHGYSPLSGFLPESVNPDPPLANLEVEVEDVVVVPDAQSAPNEVGICPDAQSAPSERRIFPELGRMATAPSERRIFPELGRMATDSSDAGGSSGNAKRQRVDELDDRCEAVATDAVPVDRFSTLPDELRLRVLTHLPLKDAIRTGALARGWCDLWKRRWAHRASLEVHLRSRDDPRRELDALAREPRPRRRLERFSLIVDTSYLRSSEFRRFLDYATECGVEDLHVETRLMSTATRLKFDLALSSPTLACLSLSDITVSTFYERPFHSLVVIRLVSVSFYPKTFTTMMAQCPSLLTLDLRCCKCNRYDWQFNRLPPNLRCLAIVDCDRITSLDSVCVPSLRSFHYKGRFSNLPLSIPRDAALSDLYIQLTDSEPMKEWMKEWNIEKLRKSLPTDLSSLNVLSISYRALMGAFVLPANGASAQLPNFNLHSLKELHLFMSRMEAFNLCNLYLFLKTFQCPNLERLFLQFLEKYAPMEGYIDQGLQEPLEDGLDNLVMVKVMGFGWNPTEVQLVSFLLRKASCLRKLLIVSRNVTPVYSPGTSEEDLSLLKEALVNGKIMLTKSDDAATQPYHEAFRKVTLMRCYR